MATGPQRYPGANAAAWYQDTYGGTAMEVNVVVLHTTEGRNLPDYGGGATAPNLTAVPDFAAKKLKWYQHFDIETSSRALVNLRGGAETNTLNVCQVELVGTCDPTTHKKWATAGQQHIYWPEAPDWALAELAAFLRWMHTEHGVPLSGPAEWPAYPSSYGATSARMTVAEWTAFKGICGHLHVVENDHGDPGAIDFPRLIALAKGGVIEEDEMPTAEDVWKADVVDAAAPPYNNTDWATNKKWSARYALGSAVLTGRKVEAKVDALTAKVDALAVGGVDLDALAEKVADLLAARLAQ